MEKKSCSFCGKDSKLVKRLIAGPEVYICNECVLACVEIMFDLVLEGKNQ